MPGGEAATGYAAAGRRLRMLRWELDDTVLAYEYLAGSAYMSWGQLLADALRVPPIRRTYDDWALIHCIYTVTTLASRSALAPPWPDVLSLCCGKLDAMAGYANSACAGFVAQALTGESP